jgi:hypothetical protein
LQGIFAGHYYRALLQGPGALLPGGLLQGIIAGHYCRALLQGIIAGHYCRALLQGIVAFQSNAKGNKAIICQIRTRAQGFKSKAHNHPAMEAYTIK